MTTYIELVNAAQAKMAFDGWREQWERENRILVDPRAAWDGFLVAYRMGHQTGCEEFREALDDMVRQFAYTGNGKRTTGGLSALENAFRLLGMNDPQPLDKWEMCDEPGCKEEATCGTPTPNGYRRTCGEHMPKTEAPR